MGEQTGDTETVSESCGKYVKMSVWEEKETK